MTQPLKERITFGKFANVDMRVVQITKAPIAEGTKKPCRVITVNAGELGTFVSVGQYALLKEEELVGLKVVACCNLAPREMGAYTSEVLILGTPHPEGGTDQGQAYPLLAYSQAAPGECVF
jgi:tRNA-binding protein